MLYTPRYNVYFYVNGTLTHILENVLSYEIWDECVPIEAFRPYPGNRWHAMTKSFALQNIQSLEVDKSILIAYQDYVKGMDTEQIHVIRKK